MALIIYFIAFLEGFTTLSIEIIAIRNFTPVIGVNSISTSVILGVILLALSYGYYIWGKKSQDKTNIPKKIALNLSVSALYYLCFSFLFGTSILVALLENTHNYFLSILITSILLFFIPIFLASQTIPLLSEMLKGNNTGEKIGKLLFFSTIGSFLGSVLTASILFATLGVEKTATFNSIILSLLALIVIYLGIKKLEKIHESIIAFCIFTFVASVFFIFQPLKKNTIFSQANSYQNIDIYDNTANTRIFSLNSGYSSGINKNTKISFFWYIQEIKSKILESKNKNILIIGAAWFTLPYELSLDSNIETLDVLDVDPSLKEIAETYFLEEKLNNKINFIPQPSRHFLYKNKKHYDSIVVDVYVGKSLAPQTLTKEFFEKLQDSGDSIYLNIITDKDVSTEFSKKLFSTIITSWWELHYKVVTKNLQENKNELVNMIVTNIPKTGYKKYIPEIKEIYTDNKNSIELDIFARNMKLLD